MKIYDLVVIGAGPAGVVATKMASEKGMSVLLIEQGKDLNKRRSLTNGFFGRGLFLIDRLELEDPVLENTKATRDVINLIKRVAEQKIKIFKPKEKKIGKYCRLPDRFGLKLASYYRNKIEKRVDSIFNTEVIMIDKNKYFEIHTNKGIFQSNKCLIATGKNSIEWIKDICALFNLEPAEETIKVGVRVEVPTFRINDVLVELGGLRISCDKAECDDVRVDSFVGEWDEARVLSAFGHCIPGKKSSRTNFMVSVEEKSQKAVRDVQIANVLTNDKIKKERIEDYMEGKSVLEHIDTFKNLREAFEAIEDIIPSFISYATMYVPEIRFRGVLPVDFSMKLNVPNLYGAGECTSKVSNLIGAMASGLVAVRTMLKE
jgi:uncharacterized FAD-dependent dehydrogenase